MYQYWIFVILLVAGVAGKAAIFEFHNEVSLTFGLGTPPQKIKFLIDPLVEANNNPRIVVSDRHFWNGVFDIKKSTTFVKTGDVNTTIFEGGTAGTDVVTLEEGVTFEKANVDVVLSLRYVNNHGWLTLARSPNGDSFIERALKTVGEDNTVVFVFAETSSYSHSGFVALGSAQPALCRKNWVNQPALQHGNQSWTIKTDEIIVGKYHAIESVPLAFTGSYIRLDNITYNAVVSELGGKRGNDGWLHVDCDLKTEIEIVSGALRFNIQPKDYIVQWSNQCRLAITNSRDGANTLPLSLLNRRCLRYDYGKNEVGIADFVL